MPRPDFITDEDIKRWDTTITPTEEGFFNIFSLMPSMKEVVYAGQWFSEKMIKLGVQEDLIVDLAYIGGRLSFGRDPWEVHQELLEKFEKELNATS